MAATLALLEWDDAHSPDATASINTSGSLEHIHKPLAITTAGWILRDDADGVTIANESCGDGDYRGLTFIPRSLVRSLTPLAKRRSPRVKKESAPDGI